MCVFLFSVNEIVAQTVSCCAQLLQLNHLETEILIFGALMHFLPLSLSLDELYGLSNELKKIQEIKSDICMQQFEIKIEFWHLMSIILSVSLKAMIIWKCCWSFIHAFHSHLELFLVYFWVFIFIKMNIPYNPFTNKTNSCMFLFFMCTDFVLFKIHEYKRYSCEFDIYAILVLIGSPWLAVNASF